MAQNKLVEITEEIEKECPVSASLGIKDGVGEGAVWTCFYKGDKFIFKVKVQTPSISFFLIKKKEKNQD